MSTQQLQVPSGRLESPQILPTFFAVVLASTLVQFNEILFPPKIASFNFTRQWWLSSFARFGSMPVLICILYIIPKHSL